MTEYGYWNDSEYLNKIATTLNQGNLVAGTSDTVIGLLAPATLSGRNALDAIKQRSEKPYIVLVSSIDQAAELSDAFSNPELNTVLKAHWPGPLTIIVPAKDSVPEHFTSHDGMVAVRVPDHEGLQQLLKKIDAPLFSTSANRSGESIPDRVGDINPAIAGGVSYLVDNESYRQSLPSTILLFKDGQLELIRKGAADVSSKNSGYNV